jgi:hypothetical protein
MEGSQWTTVGLSVPGAGHVAEGRDGDDAFAARRVCSVSTEGVALCLADGVGARAFSGAAARLAVHAAVAELQRAEPLPDDHAGLQQRAREALGAAQRAIDLLAPIATADQPAGCTFLLAIAVGDLLVCVGVGDGAVVHVTVDGDVLMPLGPDPHGGEPANVVAALSVDRPCPEPQLLVIVDAGVKAVGLCSDGLASISVVGSPSGPVIAAGSALDVLVRHVADGGEARSLRDYVATDAELRARTADDLSLVVAAR